MKNKITITKDSKFLYRFLDIAKTAIKEYDSSYVIVNSGKSICFYSSVVSGEIRLNGGLINRIVDIDEGLYRLRSTPVGSYELVKIGLNEQVDTSLCFDIPNLTAFTTTGTTIEKNDRCKISTITAVTGIPFPDNDTKLISKFSEFDVKYLQEEQILIFIAWDKEDDDLYQTVLVHNAKMDGVLNVQTTLDLTEEEVPEESEEKELASVIAKEAEDEEDDFYMPGME